MNSKFLSLNQAAKEARKSPSTIHKALKNGKLSYISKDESGYRIDPSELFRVFPANSGENTKVEQSRIKSNSKKNSGEQQENLLELALLKQELEFEKQKNELLETQLAKAEKREEKLQAVNQELATTAKSQTLLISDMREKTENKPAQTRKGFFARLVSIDD